MSTKLHQRSSPPRKTTNANLNSLPVAAAPSLTLTLKAVTSANLVHELVHHLHILATVVGCMSTTLHQHPRPITNTEKTRVKILSSLSPSRARTRTRSFPLTKAASPHQDPSLPQTPLEAFPHSTRRDHSTPAPRSLVLSTPSLAHRSLRTTIPLSPAKLTTLTMKKTSK